MFAMGFNGRGGRGSNVELDPNFANLFLRLLMDGADGSTSFTDSSAIGHVVTAHGNVQIDTDQSQFGGASALFDGSGDYLSITENGPNLDLGVNGDPFCIEFWHRANDGYGVFFGRGGGAPNWGLTNGHMITIITHASVFYAQVNASGSPVAISVAMPPADVWTHIAYTYDGANLRLFFGGVQQGSNVSLPGGVSKPAAAQNIYIGRDAANTTTYDLLGHLDTFRVYKGIAKYTSNFTPPASPFA